MRKIISQAEAARQWNNGQGCKRQRIHELIKLGRFTTPVDEHGVEKKGCVYLDEVVNFKEKPKGRPRLTEKELERRGLVGFELDDAVIWNHKPRDGYGFTMPIQGIIIKLGLKRLKLKLETPDGIQEVWANRTDCQVTDRIPESGISRYITPTAAFSNLYL